MFILTGSMIKRLIVLLPFLLMARFSFSQAGYPKLIVLNGDTAIAITKHQLDIINVTKINHDRYKEQNKNLKDQITGQQLILLSRQESIDLLELNQLDYKNTIVNNGATMDELRLQLTRKTEQAEYYRKQRNIAFGAVFGALVIEIIHYGMRILN